MNDEIKKVKRTYLTISSLFTLSASVIWGINTMFLLGAGLDILQVFIVNAIFTAAVAVFEIPTGVFADTLGRKFSFMMSVAVLIVSTLGYVAVSFYENNFILFSIMSVFVGIAFTFYSGAVEAWLVDALEHLNFDGKMEEVFSRGGMVSSIAMLIGTVTGGLLGSIDLAIPYIVRSTILILVFIIAQKSMEDIGFTPKKLRLRCIPDEMNKVAKDSIEYGLKHKTLRYLMLISVIQFSYMMWAFYAWQPYFLNLFGDESAVWIAGIVSALISLSQAFGSSMVKKISDKIKSKTRILFTCYLLQSLCLLVVGLTDNFYIAVSFFLIMMISGGVASPIKQAFLHSLVPTEKRATIISFDSLSASAGSVVGQGVLGYVSKTMSIALAYIISGVINLFVLPVIFKLRENKN